MGDYAGPVCGPRPPTPDPADETGLLAWTDVNEFIEHCFTDSRGTRIKQAGLHRDLQAFLTEHPKALVELPRDHGKSFQVCCRILFLL